MRAMTATVPTPSASLATLWRPVVAMALVMLAANMAVQYPINDWLTWGAFVYPLVFLVTDLTNRAVDARAARRVAWWGFTLAVALSLWLADPRIALASGAAFLSAQWLDIAVFNRLRQGRWWQAPLVGSVLASVLDTLIFFFIAFYGTEYNWLMLGAGDLSVKWLMAVLLLAPYRLMLSHLRAWVPPASA